MFPQAGVPAVRAGGGDSAVPQPPPAAASLLGLHHISPGIKANEGSDVGSHQTVAAHWK